MLSRKNIKLFGYKIVHEDDILLSSANYLSENKKLRDKIDVLESELSKLKKEKLFVDVFSKDPSPQDTEKYKLYVAQVAGLYKEILEPKLKHMISNALQLLEPSTNDREFDQAVKGSVYTLRELMLWGQSMINKQISFQSEEIEKNNKQNEDKE